jgi:hypothetical protein
MDRRLPESVFGTTRCFPDKLSGWVERSGPAIRLGGQLPHHQLADILEMYNRHG